MRIKKENGFSLFEVMVAMAVCVSGIVLIIGMLTRADQVMERTRLRIEQQQLCQNLAHQIKLTPQLYPDTRQSDCGQSERFWYSLARTPYPPLALTRVELSVWAKAKGEVPRNGGGASGSPYLPESSAGLESSADTHTADRLTLIFLMPSASQMEEDDWQDFIPMESDSPWP